MMKAVRDRRSHLFNDLMTTSLASCLILMFSIFCFFPPADGTAFSSFHRHRFWVFLINHTGLSFTLTLAFFGVATKLGGVYIITQALVAHHGSGVTTFSTFPCFSTTPHFLSAHGHSRLKRFCSETDRLPPPHRRLHISERASSFHHSSRHLHGSCSVYLFNRHHEATVFHLIIILCTQGLCFYHISVFREIGEVMGRGALERSHLGRFNFFFRNPAQAT
ncbi:hypothetical protein ABW21_db0203361 [Orbilia brochopaga]|nr:hypothetical protein ABW21_db0203361 [Drechslerella brochopaga]